MNLRLMALNIRQFCPDLSMPVIKQRINVRYKQILGITNWEFLHDSITMRLYGMHSSVTGETIAVTQGGVTVTGTGTTFTSWAAGDFLRVDDDEQPYIVSSVTNDTEILLERSYATDSVTASDYDIYRAYYTPSTNDVSEIVALVYQQPLKEISLTSLNNLDPERTSTGEPTHYRIVSKSKAHGLVTFEIWPIPDDDYVVTLFYKKLVSDLVADTDEPVFRAELLEAGALWDCYRHEFAVTQNPAWMGLARDARGDYQTLLREMLSEDIRTSSLPRKVRWEEEVHVYDDTYATKHDVEWS